MDGWMMMTNLSGREGRNGEEDVFRNTHFSCCSCGFWEFCRLCLRGSCLVVKCVCEDYVLEVEGRKRRRGGGKRYQAKYDEG